jgi:hypothetical protein
LIGVLYFNIEVSSIFKRGLLMPMMWLMLQLGTGVTEHRLQCRQFIATQVLAQALNSSLSGRNDYVAGEAGPKASSWMALLPPLAQAELTQFIRGLFRTDCPFSLVSYWTGCFVLPAKLNALSITKRGSLQLRDF